MAKQEAIEQRYCDNCQTVVNARRVRTLGSAPWRCDVCGARTDPLGPLFQQKAGMVPLPSQAQGGTKQCPYCAEEIQAAATKCRYCGSWLSAAPQQTAPPGHAAAPQVVVQERKGPGPIAAGFGGCLGVVLAIVFLVVLLAVCGQVGAQ